MERQLNLVVDRGNTRIKLAVFRERELLSAHFLNDFAEIPHWLSSNFNPGEIGSKVLISDTKGGSYIQLPYELPWLFFDDAKLPFPSDYLTPETLGNDRIANCFGAQAEFPDKNCLIIDLGTCITADLLIEGRFIGGSISPGLSMRFKSLNEYTGKLPLIDHPVDHVIGRSTDECLQSGAYHGTILEINARINEYQDKWGALTIILTGGDLQYFENHINCPIFADSNLTLKGLNEILLENQ